MLKIMYERSYIRKLFKVGDKVRLKPSGSTYRGNIDLSADGVVLYVFNDGSCTVEWADGTVADNVDQDRLVLTTDLEDYYFESVTCESLTMKSLEKLLFKFIKTNPDIEVYDNYSDEGVDIYSYGKTDYITLAKKFAEYIKQNNPSEAESVELMADAMYDNTYAVICQCGKRKSVYFNFCANTNDDSDSDIYVEYTYVLD